MAARRERTAPVVVGAAGIIAAKATVTGVGSVTLAPLTASITATGYAPQVEVSDPQKV